MQRRKACRIPPDKDNPSTLPPDSDNHYDFLLLIQLLVDIRETIQVIASSLLDLCKALDSGAETVNIDAIHQNINVFENIVSVRVGPRTSSHSGLSLQTQDSSGTAHMFQYAHDLIFIDSHFTQHVVNDSVPAQPASEASSPGHKQCDRAEFYCCSTLKSSF
ncbi:hypothetical protein CVT25_012516 [Psilocybe cyanescens]|uniref:Uncharacterized protein n=1 Tax=Psilocybe cyanescens TaxID=93625 RepID=A0A409X101_PSICY|nr:hypothetical protein CVT25_012516 [Psilocybe cyanescens]